MSLQVRNLQAGYGKKTVLRKLSLDVGEREIVALIGHNGAGKSTALKAMFGLLAGVKGDIIWRGRSILGRPPADNIREGIIYCPQGAEVFRTLTVRENLKLGTFPLSRNDSLDRMLPKIFELFPVLERKASVKGGHLSGGERQMLSIGMGLATAPRLAMLDEPSGGLAPMLVEALFDAIRKIVAEFNTSILVVEQNISAAFRVADRAYVMANGAISDNGSPDELSKGNRLHRSFFGEGSTELCQLDRL
jgi:branched-chain amino acid transport system ATP-binding protein